MALRTASRLGLSASLRVTRLPLDLGTRLLGGADSAAGLAVDRAEARVRALAGLLLGDREIQDDAARRHAATDERVRALRLRDQADEVSGQAEQRVAQKEERAGRRRAGAAKSAQRRKAEADERRQAREREAAEAAGRRRGGVARAKAARQDAVEERAKEARLAALEEKAEALEQEEEALIASDEARRLARAASTAKAQRKRSSNGR